MFIYLSYIDKLFKFRFTLIYGFTKENQITLFILFSIFCPYFNLGTALFLIFYLIDNYK